MMALEQHANEAYEVQLTINVLNKNRSCLAASLALAKKPRSKCIPDTQAARGLSLAFIDLLDAITQRCLDRPDVPD